ncbi:hypothetical protein ACS0PU_000648 [Formica fusca]
MILASVADICCNALLHDANYETPEEYAMHFLKKESEEQFIFPYCDENTCQRTSCSFYRTTTKKQVQVTVTIFIKNRKNLFTSLNLRISLFVIKFTQFSMCVLCAFVCDISFKMVIFISIMTFSTL